ncbi:MAG: NAD(P)H-dependent oxidoreductase subunit E [Candidatus Brocadiae bacterium]|nr:NAD(P)H-dependent oxidoreductase subunit E [Candidatus Brocadiia bacterium]
MARIGVFICWCGANIAETVDSGEVARYGLTLPGVVVSEDYKYMCSDPGQRLITDAIEKHKLSGVVVASCSPRMHETTFRRTVANVGMNPYMFEMANIREHCSWVHHDRRQATEKAQDLVRLMVQKVRRNVPLDDIEVPVTQRVMVIGAGISGIQAALDVAQAGYEVVLVERKPSIGGHMSLLDETFPTLDCSQCILTPRMVEIMQSQNITLRTYSEVEQVDGYVGNFEVKIRQKARSVDMDKCTGCGDCWNACMARNKIQLPQRRSVVDATPPDVVTKVDAILDRYTDRAGNRPLKAGGVIGILQDVQIEFNYLQQDAMLYLSEKSGIPLSQLYAVARFYHAFSLTPRGKHIIRVCLGTACHLKGGGSIADAITRELGIDHGETTDDQMFTLERVNCLGACALAPVVTVNNKYHGKMTVGKMMGLIDELVKKPEPVEAAEAAG